MSESDQHTMDVTDLDHGRVVFQMCTLVLWHFMTWSV
jgi:hypothetical protein